MNINTKFSEWLHQRELFGMRAERVCEDIKHNPVQVMMWLEAAYQQGASDLSTATIDRLYDNCIAASQSTKAITQEQGYEAAALDLSWFYKGVFKDDNNDLHT